MTVAFLAMLAPCSAAPLLINAQQGNFRSRPEYVREHFAHIDSLPFDGMALSTATGSELMNGTARSYTQISSDFAPLNGLAFTRLTHNFALVNVDRPADFFGDWSVTIENFRMLARVLKEKGIAGIFFDNEEYQGTLFNYPDDCSDPSKSLEEYRNQARLRGRQIMQAMAAEYPGIVVMAYHGPYSSFSGTPAQVRRTQTDWEYDELRGPFSVGMIEGMDSRSRFVDGGEVYGYRTVDDFQVSYAFRKIGIASAEADCPYISAALRPVWGQKVSLSFGLYNHSFDGEMNATIMRTTLESALRRCDDFVWLFFEDLNWNAPGEAPQAWIDAIVGAKAAAQVPPVGAAPSVSITNPAVGSRYRTTNTISITANASDADGSVSKVEFFSGAVKLGEDLSAPYSFSWVSPAAGIYSLTAKATDNSGATTVSSAATVTIGATFAANINFQPADVTAPVGYFPDTGDEFGSRGNGLTYGWNQDSTTSMRDRADTGDRRRATLCQFGSGAVWEIAVPNGTYRVTVAIGDGSYESTYTINVEGTNPLNETVSNYWNAQSLAAGQFVTRTEEVTVSDGRVSIDQGAAGYEDTRIDYVIIAASGAPPAAPGNLGANATSPTSVALSWADNSSTETGFELRRSTQADFSTSTLLATLGADETSFSDTTVSAGTTYYYRVRSTGSGGNSAYSNTVSETPRMPDLDSDGIPDPLESAPSTAGVDDRQIDSDSDGFSNSAEYIAGTNPLDSGSRPLITQVTAAAIGLSMTAVTLSFSTVPGLGYYVDFTDVLPAEIWTLVPGSERIGNGTPQAVTDEAPSPARFYRLRIWR